MLKMMKLKMMKKEEGGRLKQRQKESKRNYKLNSVYYIISHYYSAIIKKQHSLRTKAKEKAS